MPVWQRRVGLRDALDADFGGCAAAEIPTVIPPVDAFENIGLGAGGLEATGFEEELLVGADVQGAGVASFCEGVA